MSAIHTFGMHGGYGEATDLILAERKTGWIVDTISLKNMLFGKDYRPYTEKGIDTICRLNWGYDPDGTIPTSDKYQEFAQKAASFVQLSAGCQRWIIGNEINMQWEWPGHQQITLDQYIECYRLTYDAIKKVQPHAIVIPQAFCPWNDKLKYSGNERGDWIKAMSDMLGRLGTHVDGIAIHVYSHGLNVNAIHSDARMDAPFTDRFYNFKVYREWMGAIPVSMRSLPVYVTEANGQEAWSQDNRGWVQSAYAEIDWWNQQPGNQQIHAFCLFRWEAFDRHGISNKSGSLEDFKRALQHDYRFITKPTEQKPITPVPTATRQFTVNANVGVKVRRTPGTSGKATDDVLYVARSGECLTSNNEPVQKDGLTWYLVTGKQTGWVAESVNGVALIVPIDAETQADSENWQRSIEFVLKQEGGYANSPNDPGGETNFGISKRSHPNVDIKNLTVEQAKEIYRVEYWQGCGADKMDWPLCVAHFDFAVNAGVGTANRILAEASNDVARYVELRLNYYKSLTLWNVFGPSWLRRTSNLCDLIGIAQDRPVEKPVADIVDAPMYMSTVNANIRRSPGHLDKPRSDVIGTLKVGEFVETTGEFIAKDGFTWAKIRRGNRLFWTVYEFLHPCEGNRINGRKIIFPITPLVRVSQIYGVNPAKYYKITYSGVHLKGHNGLDFACPVGHDVVAVDDGIVTKAGLDTTGYGNHIQIRHSWGDTVYAHLSQVLAEEGETVTQGQHIGESGSTGWSTGPHLHFGLRIAPYLTTDGWGGYIDPLSYLSE